MEKEASVLSKPDEKLELRQTMGDTAVSASTTEVRKFSAVASAMKSLIASVSTTFKGIGATAEMEKEENPKLYFDENTPVELRNDLDSDEYIDESAADSPLKSSTAGNQLENATEVLKGDGDGNDAAKSFIESLLNPGSSVEKEAEKMEGDADTATKSENANEYVAIEYEDVDDDCEIVGESPSSSKSFKLKQTRVHDWIESPDKSYMENPSFKFDLPQWVDKFKDHFDYVKVATAPPSKKRKSETPTSSASKSKLSYVFRCRHCIGQTGINIQGAGSFMRHLKTHKSQYQKFTESHPECVPKKLKRKFH